jgi:hypothetical protein
MLGKLASVLLFAASLYAELAVSHAALIALTLASPPAAK